MNYPKKSAMMIWIPLSTSTARIIVNNHLAATFRFVGYNPPPYGTPTTGSLIRLLGEHKASASRWCLFLYGPRPGRSLRKAPDLPEIRANYLFFSEKILSFREKKELHD
jgi:hypothetical protein